MTVTNRLQELMRDLYDFALMADIGSRERMSFWYSGMELALARAIRSSSGLKAVVQIDPSTDPSEVTRRLALVCDLLVLSHTERSKPVPFMIMPAPPDFWSPRIGRVPVKRIDPREAPSVDDSSEASEEPETVASQAKSGSPRRQTPLPEQEPSPLAPRCTPGGSFAIARITDEPYPEAIYGWLFEEARDLVLAERTVYAPFLNGIGFQKVSDPDHDVRRATSSILKANVVAQSQDTWLSPKTVHAVLALDIPYLSDIPLPVLSKLMEDESEAITYCRNAILAACDELKGSIGSETLTSEIQRIQRNIVDEGVQRILAKCRSIEKRRWFRVAGCSVATLGAEIAAVAAGSIPGAITAAGGALAALFYELEKETEEDHSLSQYPMYIVLRAKEQVGRPFKVPGRQPWRIPWFIEIAARSKGLGDDIEASLQFVDQVHPHRYVW